MTQLFAQPIFNLCGHLIESYEDFQEVCSNLDLKPTFEFSLVAATTENAELFEVCKLDANGLQFWFDEIEPLSTYEKAALFYLVDTCKAPPKDALSRLEQVNIFKGSLVEAATELFDEIYLSEIPTAVQGYVDYEQYAYDCRIAGDLYEFTFANETYTCTNAHSH